MHNYISQRVYFRPEDRDLLLSLVGPDFDFDRIVPVPDAIRDEDDYHPTWAEWTSRHWGTLYSPDPGLPQWGPDCVVFFNESHPAIPIFQALSHHLPLAVEWTSEGIDPTIGGYATFDGGQTLTQGVYPRDSLALFEAYQRTNPDDEIRYDGVRFVYANDPRFLDTPVWDIPKKSFADFK